MFGVVFGWIESAGYLGILLLMLGEDAFPPLPAEVIMPLADYQAARGDLHIAGVIAAGTAGSVLAALFWYSWVRGFSRSRRALARACRQIRCSPKGYGKRLARSPLVAQLAQPQEYHPGVRIVR